MKCGEAPQNIQGRHGCTSMKKLTGIAVAPARYDKRILAMTTRLNLMDKRWEELRERAE